MKGSDEMTPSSTLKASPQDASRAERFSPLIAGALLFVSLFAIAVAIHSPGFPSPMIDDLFKRIPGMAKVFERGGLMRVMGIFPAEPLFMGSLYVNYVTTGMEAWPFRAINALFLALAGCTLAWMITRLLDIPSLSIPGTSLEKRAVALGLTLLYVVHPLQTFTVLYVWQRGTLMACGFFFGAVATFIAARSGRSRNPIAAYGLVAVLFFCGLVSNENAATLPIVLLAANATLFPKPRDTFLRNTAFIVLLCVAVFVVYGIVTHLLEGPESLVGSRVLHPVFVFHQVGAVSHFQIMLTECRVFFSYLMMMVVPFWHPMQLLQPQIISESLFAPPITALAVGGLISLIAAAVWLRKKSPLVALGICFTLITVAGESLFVPHYLFSGNRAILPMVGVLIVLAVGILHAFHRAQQTSIDKALKYVASIMMVAAVAGLACLTLSRAKEWTPIHFWRAAYAQMPHTTAHVESAVMNLIPARLGGVLLDAGDYHEAVRVLREAAQLDPESSSVMLHLGQALCKSGERQECIEILKSLLAKRPDLMPAWTMLADALRDENRVDEGISWLSKAVKLNPKDLQLRLTLASALIDADMVPEALAILNKVAQANPRIAQVHVQMGLAMTKLRNLPEAIRQFNIALDLDPGSLSAMEGLTLAQRHMRELRETVQKNRSQVQTDPESAEAHYRLGNALLRAGSVKEAIVHFKKAVELKPAFDEARVVLGMALLSAGRNAEAVQSLYKAVAAIKGNAALHYALGLALQREGRTAEAIQQFEETLAIDPTHPDVPHILRNLENQLTLPDSQKAQRH